MEKTELGWGGILLRLLGALILVYATYNPEGISYFHWAIMPVTKVPVTTFSAINPVKVLAGVGLLIVWLVYLQATNRSLGLRGAVLTAALLGSIIWVLIYWNVFTPRGSRAIAHIVLIVMAVVLTIGMSWSHLTRRLSGQVDTDEIGER